MRTTRLAWMSLAACLVLPTVPAALAQLDPGGPAVLAPKPTIDVNRTATYTSGPWRYRFRISAPGTRSEGRFGELRHGGKPVPAAENVGDFYVTPWGKIYWVGMPAVRWGNHGWMPTAPAKTGTQLPEPVKVEKINTTKDGTYTAGQWKYVFEIHAKGSRSERRVGSLFFDGTALPDPPKVNDYYVTPWGRIGFVGRPPSGYGANGWMPLAKGVKGRKLPDPAGDASLKLTQADNGATRTAPVGRQIVIRLAGNPTTGYQWQLQGISGPAVKADGPITYKGGRPGVMGAGGMYTIPLKAVAAGTAKVTLIYVRPWQADKPARTFSVTIIVKAPATRPAPGGADEKGA